MTSHPINNSGRERPNLSRIDRPEPQWVEPNPPRTAQPDRWREHRVSPGWCARRWGNGGRKTPGIPKTRGRRSPAQTLVLLTSAGAHFGHEPSPPSRLAGGTVLSTPPIGPGWSAQADQPGNPALGAQGGAHGFDPRILTSPARPRRRLRHRLCPRQGRAAGSSNRSCLVRFRRLERTPAAPGRADPLARHGLCGACGRCSVARLRSGPPAHPAVGEGSGRDVRSGAPGRDVDGRPARPRRAETLVGQRAGPLAETIHNPGQNTESVHARLRRFDRGSPSSPLRPLGTESFIRAPRPRPHLRSQGVQR